MPRLGENPKRGIVLLFDYYRCMAQCTLFRRALKSSASMAWGLKLLLCHHAPGAVTVVMPVVTN